MNTEHKVEKVGQRKKARHDGTPKSTDVGLFICLFRDTWHATAKTNSRALNLKSDFINYNNNIILNRKAFIFSSRSVTKIYIYF